MKNYRDYSKYIDEVSILKNPHKGFYYHYVDNGFQRPTYRNGLTSKQELLEFPAMNHIYIRFDWSDVEKEKGVYDWSCIDNVLNEWKGMKFSFRPCTYVTGPYNKQPAIPKWLAEIDGIGKRFVSYFNSNDLWLGDAQGDAIYYPKENEDVNVCEFLEPYYDHPLFLEALEKFMKAFGEKYDGDERIEYIDVGTFGRWGEGHSQTTPYGYDVLKKHIDLHIKYFPKTVILLNDKILNHLDEVDEHGKEKLEEYCYHHGLGMRDDGVCVEQFCSRTRYNTVYKTEMISKFSELAPIDIELEHYHKISKSFFRNGLPYLQSLIDTHATFTGFHGFVNKWLEDNRPLTDYIANRLGYWYFIDGAEFMDALEDAKSLLKLHITNKGFSKAYNRYDMKIFAVKGDKKYLLNRESPDNRKWLSGQRYVEEITLDFNNVPKGEYQLAIGLYEKDTPIQLGITRECLNADGSYTLDTINVQ